MPKTEPFALGLEGEQWNEEINSLLVPVGDKYIVVFRDDTGDYGVVEAESYAICDGMIPAVAEVYQAIERIKKRESYFAR